MFKMTMNVIVGSIQRFFVWFFCGIVNTPSEPPFGLDGYRHRTIQLALKWGWFLSVLTSIFWVIVASLGLFPSTSGLSRWWDIPAIFATAVIAIIAWRGLRQETMGLCIFPSMLTCPTVVAGLFFGAPALCSNPLSEAMGIAVFIGLGCPIFIILGLFLPNGASLKECGAWLLEAILYFGLSIGLGLGLIVGLSFTFIAELIVVGIGVLSLQLFKQYRWENCPPLP